MELTHRQKIRFGLISTLILGVFIVQGYTGFRKGYKWWPFLAYPMYAEAHFENERINASHRIYAVTPDGQRHFLDGDRDLKLGFWRYEGISNGMTAGKFKENAGAMALIKSRYPTLVRIEIDDFPKIITRDGPKDVPTRIVARIPRATIDEWTK